MDGSKRNIYEHEVQIFKKGETIESYFDKCPKKDRHSEYIDKNNLKKVLKLNDKHFFKFISAFKDLTGKIRVENGENPVVYGSCFVQKVEKMDKIPCETLGCRCKAWGKVTVTTACHLIGEEEAEEDEEAAKTCTVSLFDDLGGEREVKKLQGLKSHSRDKDGDWCAVVCITHDLDLLDRLKEMLEVYWELGHCLKEKYQNSEHNIVIIASHPHGGPKRLSIGKAIVKDKAREVREDQDWCYYSYDTLTCDGSSGGPVYILGKWNDGFGYWFDHQHNHSGVDRNGDGRSTIGVESLFGLDNERYKTIEFNTRVSSSEVTVGILKKNNINADDLASYDAEFKLNIGYSVENSSTGECIIENSDDFNDENSSYGYCSDENANSDDCLRENCLRESPVDSDDEDSSISDYNGENSSSDDCDDENSSCGYCSDANSSSHDCNRKNSSPDDSDDENSSPDDFNDENSSPDYCSNEILNSGNGSNENRKSSKLTTEIIDINEFENSDNGSPTVKITGINESKNADGRVQFKARHYLSVINSANKTNENSEHTLLKAQQKCNMENNDELDLKVEKILFRQDRPTEDTTLALSPSFSLTENSYINEASDNVDGIIQKTYKARSSAKLASRLVRKTNKFCSKAWGYLKNVPKKLQTNTLQLGCVNMTLS